MWKRKLEAEAPEAAIFYGSGSGKHEMNGSGSSKKILEAEAIKNSPLLHHWKEVEVVGGRKRKNYQFLRHQEGEK